MLFDCIGICVLNPAHESEMRGYLVYLLIVWPVTRAVAPGMELIQDRQLICKSLTAKESDLLPFNSQNDFKMLLTVQEICMSRSLCYLLTEKKVFTFER